MKIHEEEGGAGAFREGRRRDSFSVKWSLGVFFSFFFLKRAVTFRIVTFGKSSHLKEGWRQRRKTK